MPHGHEADLATILFEVVILLAAALAFGAVFERLRQSAIVGYLAAGTLLGPSALDWVHHEMVVNTIAELGVSLLLFAIGLEFSLRRLWSIGAIGLGGGSVQVVATLAVAAAVCLAFGADGNAAVAVGAMAALSSTACVLRVLAERTEIDSVHGRAALGILLLQDIAVVPLLLLVSMLAGGGSTASMALGLLRAVALIIALFVAFGVITRWVLPALLGSQVLHRNRELLILLAVVLALGSTWSAMALGLSPALGAFLAGMLLAESQFAMQIRADVGTLRTLFVTLFFTSIGMLGDPAWIAAHPWRVSGAVAALVLGKAAVVTIVGLVFRLRLRHAVAAGVGLAQVGEFSFVIAGVASGGGLIDDQLFRLFISATLVTLVLTPYLVMFGPTLGRWCERRLGLARRAADDADAAPRPERGQHVIVIGFGPAGEHVAQALKARGVGCVVIDLHPQNIARARHAGHEAHLGDATNEEMLRHVGVAGAKAVVVALPDYRAILQIIEHLGILAPAIPVIARGRYHRHVNELSAAGAAVVVDEEEQTGHRLARETGRLLHGLTQPLGLRPGEARALRLQAERNTHATDSEMTNDK